MSTELGVKIVNPRASLPLRSTDSVGYDLCTLTSIVLPAGERTIVDTGLAFRFPPGTYGQIFGRSGWSSRGLLVLGGVIDPGYTGEVRVVLLNASDDTLVMNAWDRIAQLVLLHASTPSVVEVERLEETERGDNGFGSTGN